MKIKKIITTFICTFCLMMLTVQVKAQCDYETITDIMDRLSINVCFDTNDKDAVVSRSEFAASVLNLMNIKAYEEQGSFKDIDASVYKKEIYTAAVYGIVGNAENFRPDDAVTYSEAITMIINAIGYKESAVLQGGYPDGYITLASSLGVTDGIKFNVSGSVSAENAVMLLFNAGNTNIYKQKIGGSVYDKEVGASVFYEYHDINYGKGILDGNAYTSLDMVEKLGDNMVSINGEIYELYYNSAVTEKLGNYVEYYYITNSDDSRVILFVDDFKNKNEITTISMGDVLGYEDGVLRYYDGGNKSENIPMNVPVIYNGVTTLRYNLEDGSSIFEQENGEIVLVDNNRDKKIDVVRITAYNNYFVSMVDKIDGIIYDKYNTGKKIDFTEIDGENQKLWIITDTEGNPVDVSEIKENDIVSAAKSLDGDVLRAVVSRNSIVGMVSSKRNDGDSVFITVDGNEYRLSSNIGLSMVNIGTSAEFYMDYSGNIAGVKLDNTKKSYGFLIKTFYNSEEEELMAKILGQDGMLRKSLKFSKKGTIDGVRYNTWEEVENLLGLAEGYETTVYPFRVILYKLNAAGELDFIDTDIPNGTDIYSLRRFSETTLDGKYITETSTIGNQLYVGSAVIFRTPSKIDENGNINPAIYDDAQYNVGTISDLSLDKNYGISAYSANPESVIPECIHTTKQAGSNTIAKSSPYMLITDKYVGLSDDEMPATILEGWMDNNKMKVALSDSYDATNLAIENINVGDFIKYSQNGFEEITSAIKVFDYVSKEEGPFRMTVDTHGELLFGSSCHLDIGTLYAVEGRVVVLKDSVIYGPEGDFGSYDPYYKLLNSTKILIVRPTNIGKPEVEDVSANLDKIKDKFHHGENNKVLIYNRDPNMKMMVVYE